MGGSGARCAALAAVVAVAAGQSCSVLDPTTGNTIDFSSLKKNPYYSVPSKLYSSYKFYFNLCGSITYSDSANPDVCVNGQTATCEIQTIDGKDEASEAYGTASSGSWTWNTGSFPDGITAAGPLYTTTNGDCTRSGDLGSVKSQIYLVCDASATTPVAETLDDNYWDCYVKVKLRTAVACGQDSRPPGGQNGDEGEAQDIGMILCVVFFVGGFVYLAGGVAYNMKVRNMEKWDAIPNKEFWQSLPGLVAAGFEFSKNKVGETWSKYRGGSSGYDAV